MALPSQREVCYLVFRFGLDRLRRSSSPPWIDVGWFRSHACSPTVSPAHSHRSIVQNQHVYIVLQSKTNEHAQWSHKLRDRIHTAPLGTMQGPKLSNTYTAACLHTNLPCDHYTLTPSELSSETKFFRASLLDVRSLAVVLQMLVESLF